MIEKPLVLIPAAGFGTRVGSPESKELLPGPWGGPLIDMALKQAAIRKWPVHVITRSEKTSLIAYLESRKDLQIQIQAIEPSREWPESVLKSKKFWHTRNLLCLPDTFFQPESIWDSLVQSQAQVAAAVFAPASFQKWGVLQKVSSHELEICEKPADLKVGMRAWGLLSFQKEAGEILLSAQLESTFDHKWRTLNLSSEFFELSQFEDLTRPE